MKTRYGFFAFTIMIGAVSALAAEYTPPPGFSLVVPQHQVKAEWVLAPLTEQEVRAAGFTHMNFRIGPGQVFWMGHGHKFLTDLKAGKSVALAQPLVDFVFLDNGALFVLTDVAMGVLAPLPPESGERGAVPVVPFQPLCDVPVMKSRIATDGSARIFVYGYDPVARHYAIFECAENFSVWRKILISREKITAVCADKTAVYAACGARIVKVSSQGEDGVIIFTHPQQTIESLALSAGGELFYGTPTGAGVIGTAGSMEFLKGRNPRVLTHGAVVYVVMPETMGILRLSDGAGFMPRKEGI